MTTTPRHSILSADHHTAFSHIQRVDITSLYFFRLHRTFVLVDGKVGVTPLDETALDMMEELAKPYAVSTLCLLCMEYIMFCTEHDVLHSELVFWFHKLKVVINQHV